MNLTEDIELQIERDIYRDSYYEFFKEAFKVLNPTDDYSDNWHIEYICNRLQEETHRIKNKEPREKDLIINVPFRSSKSLITTVCWPVWSWIIFPQMKFICTSYSAELALEHAQLSRNLMESMWFQKHFGDKVKLKKTENAKGFYVTSEGGFRKSLGIGGAVTGSGGDIVLCDDPLNPRKAASEVERKNANDYYNGTLYSRLNSPSIGSRIVIMQRLAEEDLSGHLVGKRPEDHEHICIPGELSDNLNPKSLEKYYQDNLFWPERFGKAQLNSYLKALGSYEYSGQIQQRPSPEGGGTLKKSWFDIIDAEKINWSPSTEPIMFYIDTAFREKSIENNDPCAFLACFKRKDDLYIINVHEEWMEFPELCQYVARYANSNKYSTSSKIKIEPKANGISLIQQLRATTGLNVIEGKVPKDDKITRVSAIASIAEARRVKLVRGHWTDAFLNQVSNFPVAKHDDMVDVLTMAVDDLLTSGFDFLLV